MMDEILMTQQVRLANKATLEKQGITALELMERASLAFVEHFTSSHTDPDATIRVLCGTGDNGGDGLVIARLLHKRGWEVSVLICSTGNERSAEFELSLLKLNNMPFEVEEWLGGAVPPIDEQIIIDALLGIGLNRPLDGNLLKIVQHLNHLNKHVVAVDIPTGMPADGFYTGREVVLKSQMVITFQLPKLSFFFPESAFGMESFKVVDIDLDATFIQSLPPAYSLIKSKDVSKLYKKRTSFSHKGTYGKALILAGDTPTLGAAILASEACLHAGAGLTTLCIPEMSRLALTIRCPEVMFLNEQELVQRWNDFTVVGIGPGLGGRVKLLPGLLPLNKRPMLLDADALNYLAQHPGMFSRLPPFSVITPHVKEFDRLFGATDSWWKRLQLAKDKAREHRLIIVLKNRYTFIVLPNGQVRINETGNPAMASGGMGDALSGIITAFLAQGYPPEEAATLGVYIHGRAGDLLVEQGLAVLSASQVIEQIPVVMGTL